MTEEEQILAAISASLHEEKKVEEVYYEDEEKAINASLAAMKINEMDDQLEKTLQQMQKNDTEAKKLDNYSDLLNLDYI